MSNKGNLIVISGPSGSGKTSLAKRAIGELEGVCFSVSYTTRTPRDGERDGVEYFFVDPERFNRMIQDGDFLEYASVYGNYYGTSRSFVRSHRERGQDVLLDIDVEGAMQVRERAPDATLIFVLPPSYPELRSRLENRGLDSEQIIERRLQTAHREVELYPRYDFLLVNEDFSETLIELKSIILAARCRRENRKQVAEQILTSFEEQ